MTATAKKGAKRRKGPLVLDKTYKLGPRRKASPTVEGAAASEENIPPVPGLKIIRDAKTGAPVQALISGDCFLAFAFVAGLGDRPDVVELLESIGELDEPLPGEIVHAIMDGENPVKAARKHFGITQAKLAEMAGVSQVYITRIEHGDVYGRPTRVKIAKALSLPRDMFLDEDG